jgi:hypothetical protein
MLVSGQYVLLARNRSAPPYAALIGFVNIGLILSICLLTR